MPIGQFLRDRRNCSEVERYKHHAKLLGDKLSARNYPQRFIRNARKRALYTPREVLLSSQKKPERDEIVCVTTYGPYSNDMKKIIHRKWNILTSNTLNFERPLFSFKKGKSIKDILVHSGTKPRMAIHPPRDIRSMLNLAPIKGHFPCGHCSVCCLTERTKEVNLGLFSPWVLQSHTNCDSTHVIYMFRCPCQLMYIGMTTRKAKVRLNEHRSTFRCKKTNTKLTRHYLEMGHTENDIRWVIIDKLNGNAPNVSEKLFRFEQRWVYRLHTHTHGLNEEVQWSQIGT